ncbi:MAG TPA: hypothetical protein VF469_18835 [Kofleriaceae bacterium]
MAEPGPRARWWTVVALVTVLVAGCQRDTPAPTPARGPAPPGGGGQRLHSSSGPTDPRPPAMTISLDQIRTWSEQLCTLPPIDFAGALGALGISGSLVAKTRDYSIVEPPPDGVSRLGLTRENLGKNKGNLGELEITPAGVAITRADLDARFGAGNVAPRVDFDRPHVVAYRVEVPGSPFRCTVLASFPDEPTATSVATQIRLLRNVVKTPEPGRAP